MWIEKFASRITVWHPKAYRVMTNDDPEESLFFLLTIFRIFDTESSQVLITDWSLAEIQSYVVVALF